MRSSPGMAPEASTAALWKGHPRIRASSPSAMSKRASSCARGVVSDFCRRRALSLTGFLPELAQILLHQGGLARKVLVKRSLRY